MRAVLRRRDRPLPAAAGLFHAAGLGLSRPALLATFPFIVWGVDEAWRARARRRAGVRRTHTRPAPEYG